MKIPVFFVCKTNHCDCGFFVDPPFPSISILSVVMGSENSYGSFCLCARLNLQPVCLSVS